MNEDSPRLGTSESEAFHTVVAKLLFLCKRARPDMQTAVAFLCTRVKGPTNEDQMKLVRAVRCLRATKDLTLTLRADNLSVVKWWVDAAFAVHPDMKSHTGGTMSLGTGSVYSMSRKQRLNTKSSTEAELVGADDVLPQALWTKYFLEEQGYSVNTTLYQDNQSAIKLEHNGRASSGKRTRHLNIRYFFITDRVARKELTVVYCPTKQMVADFFTKPLQGSLFRKFRDQIMGMAPMEEINNEPPPPSHRSVLECEPKLEANEKRTDGQERPPDSATKASGCGTLTGTHAIPSRAREPREPGEPCEPRNGIKTKNRSKTKADADAVASGRATIVDQRGTNEDGGARGRCVEGKQTTTARIRKAVGRSIHARSNGKEKMSWAEIVQLKNRTS